MTVAWAAIVMLVVSVLAFGLYALAPGDPARLLLAASDINPIPKDEVLPIVKTGTGSKYVKVGRVG